ncbi:universal stress protein [Martelella alba]|uniref:Universal stress protein n=1 Tax=Martelella alba TaxID=2590451 RepID=A0ABY2SSF1_9HYPH|nr:universal stress protein [Martelella alba]TKI07843.1 universal stress protein [Martelella alba]
MMNAYKHILILVQNENDGAVLLQRAESIAAGRKADVLLAHITENYRAMNYVGDSLYNDVQSREVIAAMFSRLCSKTTIPFMVKELVTLSRFKDIAELVVRHNIELVMLGHHNRSWGVCSSFSFEFINELPVDFLVIHT